MIDSLLLPDSLNMLGLVVRATILLSAALALAWLVRKGPAGIRHLLWTMTFALLLGLPAFGLLGPSWELSILPSHSSVPRQLPSEAAPVDGASNEFISLPAPDPPLSDAGSTAVPVGESLSPSRSIPFPLLLWGVGCAAALASLAVGWLRFARMVTALGGAGVSAAFAHPVQLPTDTVTAVVTARIGSTGFGDETDEYIFGDVTSVAADQHGRIYVADRISPSVRVFGSDGQFMAWIGQEGEGPGEFTWPVDILAAANGRLFVRGSRITTFAASASSEYPDSVVDTWRIPPYYNSDSWRARLVDGVYYYPHYSFRTDRPARYFYLRYGQEGLTGDTVGVPDLGGLSGERTAYYMVSQGSGRMVHGLSLAPFARRADWDMTGRGTIIMSNGETYQLREFSQDGQLLRTIDGPEVERRAVPRAERADSIRALEARIDSLPVPLDDVQNVAPEILQGEIPDSLPAFISLHVGASDRIWVERWPPAGMSSSRYYDVLEYDGRYVGTIVVPAPLLADPPPFFGEDIIVGVVIDPTTDVHSVVALRFRLPR